MNAKTTKIYVLTLSELEFFTLHKFIGHTSTNQRKEIADLTDKEDNIIEKLYDNIDEEKNNG